MKALLKMEWLRACRTWPVFIMAIGMPVGFFLFYSGMEMSPDPQMQKIIVQSYMLTMTGFSMSSFAFFTFPTMLNEDKKSHWLTYLRHSNITDSQYYLSKIFRVLLQFLVAILATFLTGSLVRQVDMPLSRWLGAGVLLLVMSLVFLAFGLLIGQIKSQQYMSIVGNIAFIGLAIIGGSWMPVSTFPDWMQTLAKWSPIYQVNQVVVTFAQKGEFLGKAFLIAMAYATIATGLALYIKNKRENEYV